MKQGKSTLRHIVYLQLSCQYKDVSFLIMNGGGQFLVLKLVVSIVPLIPCVY